VLKVLLFISLTGLPFRSPAGEPDSLADRLACYYSSHQKVYLHLDKDAYISGEDVLFKAYLVNNRDLRPDTSCKVLYVALKNSNNQSIAGIRTSLTGGTCQGLLTLPDTLATGYYNITAFTNTMRNFDHDRYFGTRIFVGNQGDAGMEKMITGIPGNVDSVSIDFYPESGVLLEGVKTRVVFIISAAGGNQPDGPLEIFNDSLRHIASPKYDAAGLGEFMVIPGSGEKYFARFNDRVFPVYLSPSRGYSLHAAANERNGIDAVIHMNLPGGSSRTVRLLAVSRGSVVLDRKILLASDSVRVSLPGPFRGLVHLALVSPAGGLVCERTLHAGGLGETIALSTDSGVYSTRRKVRVTVDISRVEAPDGISLSAGVSRKVPGLDPAGKSCDVNRYMELFSDIGISGTARMTADSSFLCRTDRFLVTRKFLSGSWEQILGITMPVCIALPENRGFIVSGKVLNGKGNPVPEILVFLSTPDSSVNLQYGYTDSEGRFRFRLDKVYNNRNLVFQLKGPAEPVGYRIELEDKYNEEKMQRAEIRDMPPDLRNDMLQARTYSLVSRVYNTSFIKRIPAAKSVNARFRGNFYGMPDETLYLSDYAELANFNEIARNILPGVSYAVNTRKIRILDNASHVMQKEDALVLVNSIPFPDPVFVSKLDTRQVRKIDLKRHHILYGDLDIQGILSITTKQQDIYPLDPQNASLVFPNTVNDLQPLLTGSEYGVLPEHLPDLRQTLFWDPDVDLVNGKATLEFYTSDIRGTFIVRVEGITAGGQPVSGLLDILVK